MVVCVAVETIPRTLGDKLMYSIRNYTRGYRGIHTAWLLQTLGAYHIKYMNCVLISKRKYAEFRLLFFHFRLPVGT